jgi:hypothetical protein
MVNLRDVMLPQITLVLAIVGGILAAPLLCDAGVAEHDCVCAFSECCDQEVTCDLDPCADVDKTENWRKQDSMASNVPALPLNGADIPVTRQSSAAPSGHLPSRNRPYPASDLPLLI